MRTSITHLIERVAAQVVTILTGETTSHFHFQKQGYLKGIAYSLNNNTNNVTSVITVLDDDTIYECCAQREHCWFSEAGDCLGRCRSQACSYKRRSWGFWEFGYYYIAYREIASEARTMLPWADTYFQKHTGNIK
jgi:hypothetical protein